MKYLALLCISAELVGCGKQNESDATSTGQPAPAKSVVDSATVTPVGPVQPPAPSPAVMKEKAAIASYADFLKAAKRLNMRLNTGISHEELVQKGGVLIDGYALIEDPGTPLLDKADTVVAKLKNTEQFWDGQDRSASLIERRCRPSWRTCHLPSTSF